MTVNNLVTLGWPCVEIILWYLSIPIELDKAQLIQMTPDGGMKQLSYRQKSLPYTILDTHRSKILKSGTQNLCSSKIALKVSNKNILIFLIMVSSSVSSSSGSHIPGQKYGWPRCSGYLVSCYNLYKRNRVSAYQVTYHRGSCKGTSFHWYDRMNGTQRLQSLRTKAQAKIRLRLLSFIQRLWSWDWVKLTKCCKPFHIIFPSSVASQRAKRSVCFIFLWKHHFRC